ncbi:MAG: hypothetical protein COT55_00655 [Candidatus Diapherotrites archaeon CG09_land_8_20_14_0_10_32_12]|nr:MAG: hypothetical protein COT55_00655 [Candidatus Diapherotrites archaeon CG09_land_8_20_14_0_10_32_12]
MAVEPRRVMEHKFKKQERPIERPLIAPQDLRVHRFINSSNGLAEIKRLKLALRPALEIRNRAHRKILVKLQQQLEKIESEFNEIKRGAKVPQKYDLATRQVTLRAIRQILLRKKLIGDQ